MLQGNVRLPEGRINNQILGDQVKCNKLKVSSPLTLNIHRQCFYSLKKQQTDANKVEVTSVKWQAGIFPLVPNT